MGGTMDKIKEHYKTIILLCVGLLILGLLIWYFFFVDHSDEEWWMQNHIALQEDQELGASIYTVTKDDKISEENLTYQDIVERMIAEQTYTTAYTMERPFIIYNPYGTNFNSVNVYLDHEEGTTLSYSVSVDDEDIPDYTQTLYEAQDGGYQLIGLVAGYENTVTLQEKDSEDKVINEFTFTITLPERKNVQNKLEVIDGDSIESLENGLFAVLGNEENYKENTYLYDNNGILRGEIPNDGYRTDRFMIIDDYLVYNDSKDSIVFVNHLGKIDRRYEVEGYKFHHDYEYDEENNRFLALVNKSGEKTMEDYIITIDVETGEVEELINMADLLPEMKEKAVMPTDNSYTGDRLDWVHLNSIDMDEDGDIIVSSRELSTVMKIKDIDTKPAIDYMVGDQSVWKDTSYADLVLEKIGEGIPNAGQHTATIVTDENLEDGQYYLILFNNNTNFTYTRPDFDWSSYPDSAGYMGGEHSYYQSYLIDENAKTYELVDSIDLPYSSIVSSVQNYNGHVITMAGMAQTISEYDEDGTLIKSYKFDESKNAYRTFKYGFEDFWFAESDEG